MGSNPAEYKGDMRPVERVSYEMIRGKEKGLTWPQSDAVDGGSFVSSVCNRAGLHVDLPTEVQWEYACRAGTTSKFNNGGDTKEDMLKLGLCADNGGHKLHSSEVGLFMPNAWQLYDMHGNVSELCLDRISASKEFFGWSDMTSERGHESNKGTCVIRRGASWWYPWHRTASDCRQSNGLVSDCIHGDWGFRLAIQPAFEPSKK